MITAGSRQCRTRAGLAKNLSYIFRSPTQPTFAVSLISNDTDLASMAELTAPVPKKIVICCDGTWQSAVSGERNSPSNVTRLARCLNRVAEQDGKIWQQIVWYDSGVGTTSSWLGKKHEGAVGAGIEGNIIEAYNFVVLNWAPGDRILCFGFSRGAYTARSIAGLISDIGICQPWQLQDFHEIWKAYKSNYQGERFHGSDAYFDFCDGVAAAGEDQLDDYGYKNYNFRWKTPPHREWGTSPESRIVEVVGVYDTVGALGLPDLLGFRMSWGPDKHGFHNVELNPSKYRSMSSLRPMILTYPKYRYQACIPGFGSR
jgi:hypothetical protein